MKYYSLIAACTLLLVGAGCSRYETVEAPALNPITTTGKTEPAATPTPSTTLVTTTPAKNPTTAAAIKSENILAENTVGGPSFLELFATTTKAVYMRRVPDGLGGYILFDTIQTPLLRIDLETGEVRKITTKTMFTSAQDVMSDDSLIAYVVNEDPRGKGITTLDPATNLQKFYPITPPAPYQIIGDVRLSPDGTEVAFALAAGNPDKERGAVYRLNLKTGKTTLVAATKPEDNTFFQVHGWTAQGTVIYK